MAARVEFPRVFTELKKLFRPVARRFKVIANTPAKYYLEGAYSENHKRAIWFGGVQRGKAYVSFHLIGVYAFPGLLKGVSPKLRARMQGKACFNFTKGGRLATKSFQRFKKEKWV